MKKLFVAVLILLAIFGWAEGAKEVKEMTVTLAGFGVAGLVDGDILDGIREEYPFLTLEAREADVATGEDVVMNALIAAGEIPDIYTDFLGRAGKYVTPTFAMALDIDESEWYADQLEAYKRGGKLYALPQAAPGQAMVLNLTFLESIGYELPEGIADGWTIDEFLELCEAVKQAGVPDVYATGLFGANPSADYLWVNWFASFGVTSFFADEYTRTTAYDPAFLETWKFFKLLLDRGYVHPNAAMWSVSPDFLQAIGKGTMVAFGSRMGWPSGMQANYNKDGQHYEWMAVPFPSVDGSLVPTAAGPHIVIGHKTSDPLRAEIIAKLVYMIATYNQEAGAAYGSLPAMSTVKIPDVLPQGEDVVARLALEAGILDVGMAVPRYMEIRSLGTTVLQKLLKGELTPEEAHREYADTITAIIR